ncbi:MAG TPA: ATP-binding cassette domain-containing protein [Aggregatilineaceae bacterium]|nr:ATP-binding cassette domain-containing protein [Aggregatilineaceae bacterium]
MSDMEPILKVENLVKRFGGLTALDHVSLELYPGECIALVGDNGAGKSTLIKIISGVYQPTEGQMFFMGRRLQIARPSEARDMGIETIYQDLALAGNLNISGNIFLGREIKKRYLGVIPALNEKRMLEESKSVLSTLDIHIPRFTAKIEKLSGGQRQAVAIARALYWNAKLLIMDEPTNNLGVVEQNKVLGLIHKLREQGVPIILISHTMQDVLDVADRIIVLRRGRKVGEQRREETDDKQILEYIMGVRNDFEPVR